MPRFFQAGNDPVRNRLSLWTKFTSPRMCSGCRAYCCTFPVEVSRFDLLRLGIIDENDLSQSPKKIANRLQKLGFIQSVRARDDVFVLQQKADESCVFLNANRICSVYDRRSEVCRKFPSIGPKPGFCPKKAID